MVYSSPFKTAVAGRHIAVTLGSKTRRDAKMKEFQQMWDYEGRHQKRHVSLNGRREEFFNSSYVCALIGRIAGIRAWIKERKRVYRDWLASFAFISDNRYSFSWYFGPMNLFLASSKPYLPWYIPLTT